MMLIVDVCLFVEKPNMESEQVKTKKCLKVRQKLGTSQNHVIPVIHVV